MMEQFSQRTTRTMADYMHLLATLRHFADRAERLGQDSGHYERNIARIQRALATHPLWLADVIITEER